MFFLRSDRAKLNEILGALEHMHNVQHTILDAIAESQKVILAAIEENCGRPKAAVLSINLGTPVAKPDQPESQE